MINPHICDNDKLCPGGNCHGCKNGKPYDDPECSPYCHPVVYKKDTVDTLTFILLILLCVVLFIMFLVCSIWGIGGERDT